MSDDRTLFYFCSVYLKCTLALRRRQHFWVMFTYGFFIAWALHFAEAMSCCVQRQWWSVPEHMPWFQWQNHIISFNEVLPLGPKIMSIHYGFVALCFADILRHAAAVNLQHFSWNVKILEQFEHMICFPCSIVNKMWVYEICTSIIRFYYHLTQCINILEL